ncbi:hypothetical protein AcV7_006063 [Taiwanofungus camphoratus]|nr:hypothetical protein AcV7_006063 [Antrodia cinnamomea]
MVRSLHLSPLPHRPRHLPPILTLSMIHICLLLALSSKFIAEVRCHPIDWLRKFSNTAREDHSWFWAWAWASDGSVSIVDRSPPIMYSARPASFGAELADPLLGYVIPLSAFTVPCIHVSESNVSELYFEPDPVQGCPDLCVTGPNEPEPNESWIALVQRGGCPFVEKARQAQRLGAKAVVVGGDKDNPEALLNMYSERDSSDVTIAATFIKYWDYVELSAAIASSNTTHAGLKTLSLLISTEYQAWEWYSPIITFVVILLLPSLLTFVTLLIHRFRAARAAQRDRAPEDIVHSFPWRVWTGTGWEKHEPGFPAADASSASNANLEQGTTSVGLSNSDHPYSSTSHDCELPSWVEQQVECAICLEMFAKGDRVRVLPCYHMFHMDEVDEWLIHKKKLCPVCKMDVTQPHPPPQPHSLPSDLVPIPNMEESPADNHASSHSSPAVSPAPTERTPLLRNGADHSYEAAS